VVQQLIGEMSMAKKKVEAQPVVLAYKGFGPDWKCRDFQYALGESYEHSGKVGACESGFHACEYPLHVLRYYKPNTSHFALVEQSGTIARHGEDSKVASSRITVKAEIGLTGLIKAAVEYTLARCTVADGATSNKPNTVVKAEGKNQAATASGDYGAATASGNSGAATASGDYGAATASGDSGAATASGNSGAATASGDYGAATASGRNGRARGKDGCALFLTERDGDWKIITAWAGIVGRDGIKADTYYTLRDGAPQEVA
jgi:hypothetical protein